MGLDRARGRFREVLDGYRGLEKGIRGRFEWLAVHAPLLGTSIVRGGVLWGRCDGRGGGELEGCLFFGNQRVVFRMLFDTINQRPQRV